jgi:hypothetical protein
MIPQITTSAPANWRDAYAIANCAGCGTRGLFVIGSIPMCDDCIGMGRPRTGIASDIHPSDVRYHGDTNGDYAR